MSAAAEWAPFVEGRGAPAAGGEWSSLETLWHGTHLTAALRIAEDRMIAGGLIYDGKLLETRTEVIYFSPNTWGDGSRYGSFQFEIEWKTLIDGRSLYWVEPIRAYQIPIYRFLVSRHDVRHLPVVPYNPDIDEGPLRRAGDQWFWATGWAAEIVIDEAVPVHDLSRLRFEKHHDNYCSEWWLSGSCREKGWSGSWNAHAKLAACLLGRPLKTLNDLLVENDLVSSGVEGALSQLWVKLIKGAKYGGPISADDAATDLVRAACLTFHAGDLERARRTIGLIDTQERADQALLTAIIQEFGIPSFDWD